MLENKFFKSQWKFYTHATFKVGKSTFTSSESTLCSIKRREESGKKLKVQQMSWVVYWQRTRVSEEAWSVFIKYWTTIEFHTELSITTLLLLLRFMLHMLIQAHDQQMPTTLRNQTSSRQQASWRSHSCVITTLSLFTNQWGTRVSSDGNK